MDETGDQIDQGLALVPMSDLAIEDTWFVAGMRGTASNTLVASEVFVPSHLYLSVPQAIVGIILRHRAQGRRRCTGLRSSRSWPWSSSEPR